MTQEEMNEKLKHLAEHLDGSYPDFVKYTVSQAQKHGISLDVIQFIENNEGVDDQDVSYFIISKTKLNK